MLPVRELSTAAGSQHLRPRAAFPAAHDGRTLPRMAIATSVEKKWAHPRRLRDGLRSPARGRDVGPTAKTTSRAVSCVDRDRCGVANPLSLSASGSVIDSANTAESSGAPQRAPGVIEPPTDWSAVGWHVCSNAAPTPRQSRRRTIRSVRVGPDCPAARTHADAEGVRRAEGPGHSERARSAD